ARPMPEIERRGDVVNARQKTAQLLVFLTDKFIRGTSSLSGKQGEIDPFRGLMEGSFLPKSDRGTNGNLVMGQRREQTVFVPNCLFSPSAGTVKFRDKSAAVF